MEHMLDKDVERVLFSRRSCTGGWRRSPPDRPGLRGEGAPAGQRIAGLLRVYGGSGARSTCHLHRGL